MEALRWWLRRATRRLGAVGYSAIALFMAALGIFLAGIFPIREEVEVLRAEVAAQPTRPVTTVPVLLPEQLLAEELTTFDKRFPTVDALSDVLEALFTLAGNQGLEVNRGEYTLVEKAGGILRRFEVTLPVTGTYSQIRGFVLQVLEKLPSTALADLAFERGKIAEGQAMVSLRFIFFVRKLA
jgi:hypothetical protein